MSAILPLILSGVLLVCVGILVGVAVFMWREARKSPARVTCFVRSWKPFDDAQLRAALSGWNDTDPRWRALWDLLAREVEAELGSLTGVKSDAQELARAVGRLEELLHLRAQLLVFRGREPRE